MSIVRTLLLAAGGLALATGVAAQTVIKIGHDQPEKSTHHQAILKWKQAVEARTKGAYEIQSFPAMTLGSGVQMVEQLQAGAIQAVALPSAWIAPIVPDIQVLDLPFLFPSRAVLYKVVDGPVGAEILKPLNKANLQGIAFWESGFKQFTGNFPIRQPKDYQGHKIRTMPAPVIMEQFKAFGASPVAIDFKELYNALQQKVVDGQENPIATIALMRFFEVQKYLTLSDHGFIAYIFVMNKSFLDSQPADMRKILVEEARAAGRFQRDIIAKSEAGHLETFRKAGVEIIKLSDEQRAMFQKASRRVYDWYAKKKGAATLDLIRKAVMSVTMK
jgi:C4-dicarboxylate-binding protein DctP